MTDPTADDLIASLHSDRCPTCGEQKLQGWSVCHACHEACPIGAKAALAKGNGDERLVLIDAAYVIAMQQAMAALDVNVLRLPEVAA